jgi:hypothetical protein
MIFSTILHNQMKFINDDSVLTNMRILQGSPEKGETFLTTIELSSNSNITIKTLSPPDITTSENRRSGEIKITSGNLLKTQSIYFPTKKACSQIFQKSSADLQISNPETIDESNENIQIISNNLGVKKIYIGDARATQTDSMGAVSILSGSYASGISGNVEIKTGDDEHDEATAVTGDIKINAENNIEILSENFQKKSSY